MDKASITVPGHMDRLVALRATPSVDSQLSDGDVHSVPLWTRPTVVRVHDKGSGLRTRGPAELIDPGLKEFGISTNIPSQSAHSPSLFGPRRQS